MHKRVSVSTFLRLERVLQLALHKLQHSKDCRYGGKTYSLLPVILGLINLSFSRTMWFTFYNCWIRCFSTGSTFSPLIISVCLAGTRCTRTACPTAAVFTCPHPPSVSCPPAPTPTPSPSSTPATRPAPDPRNSGSGSVATSSTPSGSRRTFPGCGLISPKPATLTGIACFEPRQTSYHNVYMCSVFWKRIDVK